MSQYIRIVNWDKMQHYKDRNPPWIKLHRELLTSETWVSSSNDDRVLAIAIMMLAADTGNLIPANPRYIQRRAYLDGPPDLSGLVSLNFIEIIEENEDASKPLADARPETETETEGEKSSVTIVTDAEPEIVDPSKIMFDSGVSLIVAAGKSEAAARTWLGKAKKTYGAEAVIIAIGRAKREGAMEPVGFMEGCLRAKSRDPTALEFGPC